MKLSTGLLMGAALLLSVAIAPKAHGQAASDGSKQKTGTSPSQQAAANDAEYKIGPQDVLRIDVWKEPEISRTAPVRPDGRISLPLINDVQAAGLTATQLAAVIADGLRKYITSPQVTVGVTEINSRRVYVTGEVTRPGAFPLLPNMTVLQALSSSGGFSQFAKLKNIYVLRTEDGKQVKHPFNYKAVVSGKKPELNIPLQPGDVIVVP
ncbi:MAG: polysaccharide biosynthesis/export family protein [Candidatus Acidiferrum sp.]|jgi:polysaccharide biosynthesis/export protein